MRILLILILSLFEIKVDCQINTIYHTFRPTDSDYEIIKWNVNKDSLSFYRWYIKESYDNKGRVVRLDYFENGQYAKFKLCYLPNFVIYNYPNDSTIVEKLYNYDKTPMNGLECEVDYKRTYKIDKSFKLLSLKIEYYIDTSFLRENPKNLKDIKYELDYLNQVKDEVSKGNYNNYEFNFIDYYFDSYMKNNRHFPIRKGFDTKDFSKDCLKNIDAYNCIKK